MKRIIIILSALLIGCDYGYFYEGRVGIDNNSNSVITSKIFLLSDTTKPIQGVQVSIYLLKESHSMNGSFLTDTVQSDSTGMFSCSLVYNRTKINIALIAMKEGYYNDTLYCVFKARDTNSVLIKLKKMQ